MSFVEAARALAPQIQTSADEIERSRRLPLPLVEAIAKAGLFRLWVPRRLGGEEADPATLVRVVEEISRADGATGWCVAIGSEYGSLGDTSRPMPPAKSMAIRKFAPPGHCAHLATPWWLMAATVSLDAGRLGAGASIPNGLPVVAGF
jgi:hypothetical protein